MRKLFILMIMVAWCNSVLAQNDIVKFSFKGGISQLDDSAIVYAETNITKLLTEINRANTKNRSLNVAKISITDKAKERLLDYWDNIHFYCSELENEKRITSSGGNIKIEGIPIILNPSENTYHSALQKKLEIDIDSWGEIVDVCIVSRRNDLSTIEGRTFVVEGFEYYIGFNGEAYVGAASDKYLSDIYTKGFVRDWFSGELYLPNYVHYDDITIPVVGITGLSNCEKTIKYESDPSKWKGPEELSFLAKTTAGFRDCPEITSVSFPKNMKSIKAFSFWNCYRIGRLNFIDNSILAIDSFAFANCGGLYKVEFPKGLEKIGKQAFFKCNLLHVISIPASVNYIGEDAFSGCHLTEIHIDKDNHSFVLEDGILFDRNKTRVIVCMADQDTLRVPSCITSYRGLFTNNGMRVLQLPDDLKYVEDSAFWYNHRLSKIILPKSLEELGRFSFSECSQLDSVYIPDNVKFIWNKCFSYCFKLKTLSIPYTLLGHISRDAFSGCPNLRKIEVRYPYGKNKMMKRDNKKLYMKSWYYSRGKKYEL